MVRKLTTRRTDLMDTSGWAQNEMLRRYRAMTPEQRLAIMLELLDQVSPEAREREEAELIKRFRQIA